MLSFLVLTFLPFSFSFSLSFLSSFSPSFLLGASAYSGGLWLCALSAASAMCHEMDLERKAAQYHEMYLKAKKVFFSLSFFLLRK